jgi:lauroyl/myristoyl acyltransferase
VTGTLRRRAETLRLAPDGAPRPGAPLGRGPVAARVLARVIDGAAWAGCRVPAGIAHGLATVGGHCEWAARPGKRRALAANLAHAVGLPPEARRVRRLVRREMVNEAHRSADLLWALGRREEFLATVTLDGGERARDAAERGGGVILAGIHLGGWEVATPVPARLLPVPVTVITADDWLAWAIDHQRARAGMRVMYRSEPALRAARLLRRGEALLLLGDDEAGSDVRSFDVRFLDGRAMLPGGIVSLARLTGAPIVSFYVLPEGPRRWRVLVDEAVAAPGRAEGDEGERRVLQSLADRWSEVIRAHPEQWAASHPIRWLEPGAPAP